MQKTLRHAFIYRECWRGFGQAEHVCPHTSVRVVPAQLAVLMAVVDHSLPNPRGALPE